MSREIINNYEASWYGDLYLKFADESEAATLLVNYAGSIDIIGEIEGVVGWHVNIRGPYTLELLNYSAAPQTPHRIWA